jgi:ribosomal protein L16 Arg81 hydroxylase
MHDPDGIARLIDPVPTATFIGEYWQEKPLVVRRGQAAYFADLLSVDQIGELLSSADLPSGTVDVADADAPVDRSRYEMAGVVDILKVQQLYSKGATLVLSEVQRWLPQLARLCRVLEKEFSGPFQTNIYLTPAQGRGFRPHYDTHDVFILQVAGAKEWTVCANPVALPLPSQPFDRDVHAVGETRISCELHAGDVLYIPRGFVHHARCLAQTSLHVTLGALLPTWADLLQEIASELALTDPAFRRTLPADLSGCGFDAAAAQRAFAGLLQRMDDPVLLRSVLERRADNFVLGRRPLAPGQFDQLANLPKLSVADQASPRPGVIYRSRANGESVVVLCHGREIVLPRDAAEALDFALRTPRYAISEIPGRLDDAGKLALVRRLIEEGLVMCYMHRNA